MSIRPARKVELCHQTDAPLFTQDEICLLDPTGATIEVMRLRTYDPTTLALRAERLIDILTGADASGTPVGCPCNNTGGNPRANALRFLNGLLTSTVNVQSATIPLRGESLESLGGIPLGYLLPTT